ncbi:putative ferric reductase [Metarhizium anisopliae]
MDMGDMHMHDAGLGMDYNYAFARDYWYIIAVVVGGLTALRSIEIYTGRQRLKACKETSIEHATRPGNHVSQAWATATAITREMSHPQLYVSRVGFRWATPPPLGRIIVLLCYWAMIIYFMSWNAVKNDAYFWERIGYRNAWVSIMQLPFIFLLSMKFNVVGFLIGSSHERLNWLHRWVARTMFVTATVHGWHFWTEWVRADFLEYELSIMPLVRYGLGAWGVLLFNVVVGFVPIRRMVYEIWLIQHVLSSVAMLALLGFHIPADARYLLWMSVSFLAFDRAARGALTAWQNTRWKPSTSACEEMRRLGHNMSSRAIGDSITVLTIKDVHFKWHAGQHIYLWIPRLGLLESHPYTIACAHQIKGTCCCNSIQLIIRSHGGFSKRIHDFAVKNPAKTLSGYVLGPFGVTTRWETFETLVLIGASTGASFTVPIMEYVAYSENTSCVRRLEMTLVARTAEEMEYYVERARDAARSAQEKGIMVRLHIAITGGYSETDSGVPLVQLRRDVKDDSTEGSIKEKAADSYSGKSVEDGLRSRRRNSCSSTSRNSTSTVDMVREYASRPDIEALLREPVEQAWGETAVVVCGGKEIVARTRNCVGKLSDERAVHKGTGAQGIYLHVEEYAF